jgi:hypothetical protein
LVLMMMNDEDGHKSILFIITIESFSFFFFDHPTCSSLHLQ